MADFSLSQVGGPSGSSASPTPGVQQPSGVEAVASLFTGLAKGIAASQPPTGQQAQALKDQQYSQAGSRFANQQLQIAQAVDAGQLSSQEARMRMRANYASAIANNPDIVDELTKLHKSIIGTKGLGAVAAEGTAQEQAFLKAQQDATLNGWVTSGMSQEEAAAATSEYMQFNKAQDLIDAQQNQLALSTARINNKTAGINQRNAQLTLQNKQAQQISQQALGQMGAAYFPKIRRDFESIIKDVNEGKLSANDAVDQIDGMWASVQQQVSQVGSEAGTAYITNMMAPIKTLYDLARKRASGELDAQIFQNQADKAIARQTALIAGDPENARIMALGKSFPNATNINTILSTDRLIKMVGKNMNKDARPVDLTDPENNDATDNYLSLVKDNINAKQNGTMVGGVEAENELDNHVNNILKGVNAYSNSVDNPQEYNKVVDFLASSEFGNYATSGGNLNSESAQKAQQVLDQQYRDVIVPLLAEEWKNSQVTTSAIGESGALGTMGTTANAQSVIQPVWSGTGMSFVANDQSSPGVNAKVSSLNKKVAPIVNRLIRMGAHLQGTKNYKQVYEANYAGIFGQGQQNETQ